MAITVVSRPLGHKLSETQNTATVTASYGPIDASFVKVAHGLVDGDYIYAESLIEDYNGFWYVDKITNDNFKLKAGPGADFLQWVANGSITYYVSTMQHGWSCVHLPIVYKLSTNLFPNTVDTTRTVSSFTDDNGYVNLNLSGALGASIVDLDYIKISGSSDEDLNGIWQITDAVSTSDVTINLAYDAGLSLVGASVQFYYNNYHIRVKVFGGLGSDHQYEYLKPFRELAELRLIPDDDGQVMFSVNEYLKELINTRNNTLLASLPCNLDFFTQFYISYAESYDVSDGSEVTTNVGSYTSDQYNDGWSPVAIDALNLWSENGSGAEWSNTTTPQVTLTDNETSENKYVDETMTQGEEYRILYSFSLDNPPPVFGNITIRIRIKDSSDTTLLTKTITIVSGTSSSGTYTFTAPANASRISISAQQVLTIGSGDTVVTINSISLETDQSTGFDGYAANAELPFKNQYSGYMTEYINGKWLTNQDSPLIFDGQYFDLSAIVAGTGDISVYINGDLSDTIEDASPGIYRIPITATGEDMVVKLQQNGEDITDDITLTADEGCSNYPVYLTWLNNLGGFDYLEFKAKKDHIVEITESSITKQNIFPSWPQSYGSIADTIRKQTVRTSNKAFTIRSQHLTQAQVDSVAFVKSSVLVQIMTTRTNRLTVVVDDGGFVIRRDGDDTYSIAFNIAYTDDIPVQTV